MADDLPCLRMQLAAEPGMDDESYVVRRAFTGQRNTHPLSLANELADKLGKLSRRERQVAKCDPVLMLLTSQPPSIHEA